MRYGVPELVEEFARQAIAQGYTDLKLHEVTEDCIAAGRRAAPDATITVDANCQIDIERAVALAPFLREQRIDWLEEPTFPPEGTAPWRRLGELGIAVAAGENVCTLEGFTPLIPSLAVVQPSVTKVGGVTEFLRVRDEVKRQGKRLAPHSPYFGPGYWATLQLAAALEEFSLIRIPLCDAPGLVRDRSAGASGRHDPHSGRTRDRLFARRGCTLAVPGSVNRAG